MLLCMTRTAIRTLVATAALLCSAASPGHATEVTFRFRAPEGAKAVTVAGTFNGWNTTAAPMTDTDGDGVWETTLRLAPGTYQYKFVVDGTQWFKDEFASDFVDDGFGGENSVTTVKEAPLAVGDTGGATGAASGTAVTFRFEPRGVHANSVSVVGTFNQWNAAAQPMADGDGDGVWEIELRLEPGEYAYQFVLNGDEWVSNDLAAAYQDDGFGGRDALLTVGATPVVVDAR
jgi:1,4-alpha-glucan branching enzyme